ncbi:MAG: alpha-amylase [Euryarchaeota archaeon]|nr:alpha-amylase [Euryarchaeota archaeon]
MLGRLSTKKVIVVALVVLIIVSSTFFIVEILRTRTNIETGLEQYSEITFVYNPYKSVIYQIVTDRFYDGNPENNEPYYNPKSLYKYHGGDFEGIMAKLDYLKDLGIGAIWISPPFDNVDKLIGSVAPYHGYWPKDYTKPDEHFGTWEDFKRLCKEARKRGIAVIIDVVPNHTNPSSIGEYGALYYNGKYIAAYIADRYKYNHYEGSREGYFHHNGDIGSSEWDIPWNTRYKNLFGLADLNQMNNTVDWILKSSLKMWIMNGSLGVRIDAAKHMDPMWLRSYYSEALKVAPIFGYAEWYITSVRGSLLYWDAVRLQRTGGIAILNIPLRSVIVEVFAHNKPFSMLDHELITELNDLSYDYLLVNFLDNHDLPRYLKEGGNITTMHMAMTFVMTIPGVPIVYYGDEIYLKYKGPGQGDPYNRLQMVFTEENNKTIMARLIRALSSLRKTSDALAYGSFKSLYVDNDVYVYGRDLPWETIIVAFSRTPTKLQMDLNTAGLSIPDGTYYDYLEGLLGGSKMIVSNGTLMADLRPYTVSIWYIQKGERPSSPYIGATMPSMVIPGTKMIIFGKYLENSSVIVVSDIGKYQARILIKTDEYIVIEVPKELNSEEQFVDIIVEDSKGSHHITLPFRHPDARPIVLRIKDIPKELLSGFNYIFVNTSLGELREPIPAMIADDGTVFAILDVRPASNVRINIYVGFYSGTNLKYVGSTYISTTEKYVSISLTSSCLQG